MSQRVSSLTYLVAMDEMKEASEQLQQYTMEIRTLNKSISKTRTQLDLKQKKLKAAKRNLESRRKTLAKLKNAEKQGSCAFRYKEMAFDVGAHIEIVQYVEVPKASDNSFGDCEMVHRVSALKDI